MSDLCLTFLDSAVSTWRLLERADRVSHHLGEESITDLLVIKWLEKLSGSLITVAHTKHAEARSGADWEWWFVGRSGLGLGIRVQAKVLDMRSRTYESLHKSHRRRQPPRDEYQCEVLIEAAARATPPMLPLYVVYSHWDPVALNAPTTTAATSIPGQFGCAILSTNAVRFLRANRQQGLRAVGPLLRPLHELVCPETAPRDELPVRVAANLSEIDRSSRADQSSTGDVMPVMYGREAISEVIPEYVDSLRTLGVADLPDDVGGLVVFTEAD